VDSHNLRDVEYYHIVDSHNHHVVEYYYHIVDFHNHHYYYHIVDFHNYHIDINYCHIVDFQDIDIHYFRIVDFFSFLLYSVFYFLNCYHFVVSHKLVVQFHYS